MMDIGKKTDKTMQSMDSTYLTVHKSFQKMQETSQSKDWMVPRT